MKKFYINTGIASIIICMILLTSNLYGAGSQNTNEMIVKTNIQSWLEKQYYESSMDGMNGIIESNIDLKSGNMKVSYYPDVITADKILEAIESIKNKHQLKDNESKLAAKQLETTKEIKIQTTGDNWLAKNQIEAALNNVNGIIESNLNIVTGNVNIKYNPDEIKVESILELIKNLGYEAVVCSDNKMTFN